MHDQGDDAEGQGAGGAPRRDGALLASLRIGGRRGDCPHALTSARRIGCHSSCRCPVMSYARTQLAAFAFTRRSRRTAGNAGSRERDQRRNIRPDRRPTIHVTLGSDKDGSWPGTSPVPIMDGSLAFPGRFLDRQISRCTRFAGDRTPIARDPADPASQKFGDYCDFNSASGSGGMTGN